MPEISRLMSDQHIDLQRARKILAAIERAIHRRGGKRLQPLLLPVQVEIAVATAEDDVEPMPADGRDPLFRLNTKRWAVDDRDLFALIPVRDPRVRVIAFDFDVSSFMDIRTADKLLDNPVPLRQLSRRLWPIGCRTPRTASRPGGDRRISRMLRRNTKRR